MNPKAVERILERRKKELEWAKKNDPAGIAQLVDGDTGEVVYESYRPSVGKLNKEIGELFSKE